MANFSSTADYLDSILLLSGEPTNGNSPYESRALHYLNRIHNNIIVGGNEFNVEVDELWPWSLAQDPMIIEVEPAYTTGSASVVNGDTDLTLSVASSQSRERWFIKFDGEPHVYRISKHLPNQTDVVLDSPYLGATSTAKSFTMFKLDYELIPTHITISDKEKEFVFAETTAATQIESSVSNDTYTPSQLANNLETVLNSSGASTYTVSYDSILRKFTITSDGSGADGVFSILGASASEAKIYDSVLPTMGFGLKDYTGALSYTSQVALGAVSKLVQPIRLDSGGNSSYKEIYGVDPIKFQEEWPLSHIKQGTPTHFTITEERSDGFMRIRLNAYPEEKTRMLVPYAPVPQNLYDNTKSHPLIPRKYSQVLEYGAAAYLLREKNDNRAQDYFAIAGRVLESMVLNRRKESKRIDPNFANIIAREDLMPYSKRRKRFGYTADSDY